MARAFGSHGNQLASDEFDALIGIKQAHFHHTLYIRHAKSAAGKTFGSQSHGRVHAVKVA